MSTAVFIILLVIVYAIVQWIDWQLNIKPNLPRRK